MHSLASTQGPIRRGLPVLWQVLSALQAAAGLPPPWARWWLDWMGAVQCHGGAEEAEAAAEAALTAMNAAEAAAVVTAPMPGATTAAAAFVELGEM